MAAPQAASTRLQLLLWSTLAGASPAALGPCGAPQLWRLLLATSQESARGARAAAAAAAGAGAAARRAAPAVGAGLAPLVGALDSPSMLASAVNAAMVLRLGPRDHPLMEALAQRYTELLEGDHAALTVKQVG